MKCCGRKGENWERGIVVKSEFFVTLIITADVSGDEMAGAFSQLLCVYQLSLSAPSSQVGKVTMVLCY